LFLNQLNINICIPTFVALLLGEYKWVCNFSFTGEKPVILPVKPSSNLLKRVIIISLYFLGSPTTISNGKPNIKIRDESVVLNPASFNVSSRKIGLQLSILGNTPCNHS